MCLGLGLGWCQMGGYCGDTGWVGPSAKPGTHYRYYGPLQTTTDHYGPLYCLWSGSGFADDGVDKGGGWETWGWEHRNGKWVRGTYQWGKGNMGMGNIGVGQLRLILVPQEVEKH